MNFMSALRQQRWDDHRYYHHSMINQTLHFFSALCFLASYLLLFVDFTLSIMIGWLLAMVLRQCGHFFFEPKGFDVINRASHDLKESIKVGYNLKRKIVLLSCWVLTPMMLLVSPDFFSLLPPAVDIAGFLDNTAVLWFGLAVVGIIFRTVQLFWLQSLQSGFVWFVKIITDPLHDILIYHRSPIRLLRGERIDDMRDWYSSTPS